jgi:hypothetical protein
MAYRVRVQDEKQRTHCIMLTVLLRMYLVPSEQSYTSGISAGQYVLDSGKKEDQVSGVLSKCMQRKSP